MLSFFPYEEKETHTAAMTSVLIVEDEPAIADALVYALETENFQVTHVTTGEAALPELESGEHGLAVLDIGLPDITGLELCKAVRQQSDMPILFLTARTSEIDQILGLELGADDYVAKPFSPRAVVARIRAILRRGQHVQQAADEHSLLHHDQETMTILCKGEALNLTAHEYKLLASLLASPNRVFTREQLLDKAWEDPCSVTDRTVDAHVKSLRAKLREADAGAGEVIQTRRGLGYLLEM